MAKSFLADVRALPRYHRCTKFIDRIPVDLLEELKSVAREYESGKVSCQLSLIYETLMKHLRDRKLDVTIAEKHFKTVFKEMRREFTKRS